MQPEILALFGALVADILDAVYKAKGQRRRQVLNLAAFIENVSESLLGMHKKLSNGEVPTADGNRLEQQLRGYADVVAKSRASKETRNELERVLGQLETLLMGAEFEDEIIRGVVLTYDRESRKELLEELERTAGQLRGMSDNLRGSA